jgi:hypothetical protein
MNREKTTLFYVCVYIYKAGSQLGLPGSTGFRRVKSLFGFYLDPALGPGQLGPWSTRWARLGFKIMPCYW